MHTNVEFESLKDDVLRKIGRLVMSFQQIEHLLKRINTYGVFSSNVSEVEQKLRERENKILHGKNYNLGSGVFDYKKHFLSPEIIKEEQKKEDSWVSYQCRFECDDTFSKEKQNTLDSLLTERNYLIHNLLSDWDFLSFESTKKIESYLDQLQEKLVPEILFLQSHFKLTQEGLKEHKDFIDSDEGSKIFELAPLRGSLIVQTFFYFAENYKRPDGWVSLSSAKSFIKDNLAKKVLNEELMFDEGFAKIKNKWGLKDIRKKVEQLLNDDYSKIRRRYNFTGYEDMLKATEWFDIDNEPCKKVGSRVIYRIKPNLVITGEHITWPVSERRLNG